MNIDDCVHLAILFILYDLAQSQKTESVFPSMLVHDRLFADMAEKAKNKEDGNNSSDSDSGDGAIRFFSEAEVAARRNGTQLDDDGTSYERDLLADKKFADTLESKQAKELSMKEREKIYYAVDLVQKNYLELRKDQDDGSIYQLVDSFIESKEQLKVINELYSQM